MNRRVHVAEIPFVGRKLTVRVHVPLAEHEHELILRKIRIDERQRNAVEGEIPRRVPRVLPSVGHREDVGIVEVRPLVVSAFAPLLVILMIQPVLVGAHNARRNGRLLLMGATMNVFLNFTLDVVLGFSLGVVGVALSSSITAAVVLAFFAWRLSVSEPAFTIGPIARTMSLALVASAPVTIVAAVLCWMGLVPSDVVPAIATLLGIGIIGLIGYLLAAFWLGMEEPRTLVRLAIDRLFRRRLTARAE